MSNTSKADWDALLVAQPVNKTAALVTGQPDEGGSETPEQQRENLVTRHKALRKEAEGLPKNHWRRKQIGKELQECQAAISAIRPKRKGPKGVAGCFVDVCREQMCKAEFQRILKLASIRAEQGGGEE